ncbi:hypothetical protein C8R44DRAFT_167341 [Mycena epipterygia]|nr:hypothetical protein C8R44DRAFT_167341 [Mycena epipterygia]
MFVIILGLQSAGKTFAKAVGEHVVGDEHSESGPLPSKKHVIHFPESFRGVRKTFLKAARRVNSYTGGREKIHVVKYYYPRGAKHRARFSKPPQRATLVELETATKEQIEKITGAPFDCNNVCDILFAYSNKKGESTGFPFDKGTCFLGFQGPALFRKLLVVDASRDNDLKRDWNDLISAGMHVTSFDGTLSSARSALHLHHTWDKPPPTSELQSIPMIPNHLSTTLSLDNGPQAAYQAQALAVGRHADQAIVLLVGHSGHGKSKTINRLLGQDLLPIGKSTLGSTTKVIQRVKLPAHSSNTGVTVTIAFDDTPGFEDTTHSDRDANASLMRRYTQLCFSRGSHRTYPNVILLVASWDSITPDAHNEPQHFTSALGKSMYNLSLSDLIDHSRTNVVVVVTKSMSSWNQFDDFETTAKKNNQWNIEAGRRMGIITDLQRKVFPKLAAWRTVFVENGGGRDMRMKYPKMPNGELSHQNLFQAIRGVIEAPGPDGTCDLAGMHALDVLTGAGASNLASQADIEILVRNSLESALDSDPVFTNPHPPSYQRRVQELSDTYLGVTYDPIHRSFGRTCVLDLAPSAIKFEKGPPQQPEDFMQTTAETRQEQGDRPDGDGLKATYSSSSGFQSAESRKSESYIFRHLVEVATINSPPSGLQLSTEMRRLIERLPPWSLESQQQYDEFFANHGTHVVKSLALGGVLRVLVDSASRVTKEYQSTVKRDKGDTTSSKSTHTRNVMIFRDGGAPVAAELTRVLEDYFTQNSRSPSHWQGIRTEWINSLEKDPVFCPDDPKTQYEFLYNLQGLDEQQRYNLRQASKSYLAPLDHKFEASPTPRVSHDSKSALPRKSNLRGVRQMLSRMFNAAMAMLTGSHSQVAANCRGYRSTHPMRA